MLRVSHRVSPVRRGYRQALPEEGGDGQDGQDRQEVLRPPAVAVAVSRNESRPYRVVTPVATIGVSPALSQSRGTALPSQSVLVSGSSKHSIHLMQSGMLFTPADE